MEERVANVVDYVNLPAVLLNKLTTTTKNFGQNKIWILFMAFSGPDNPRLSLTSICTFPKWQYLQNFTVIGVGNNISLKYLGEVKVISKDFNCHGVISLPV